jgi:S-DNA-T family DNA segregation ATPase FtsK/SpoIIIE
MARRKPKQEPISFVGKVKKVVTDDRIPKIFGLVFYLIAIFLFISLTSYLFTWRQDQDKVIDYSWGTLFDKSIIVDNWFGKMGAVASHILMYLGVGVSSFALIFLCIRIGYRLINGKGSARIWPMLRNVLFFIALGCTFFELILPQAEFPWSGSYGISIVKWGDGVIGRIGVWLVFSFVLCGLAVWFRNFDPGFGKIKNWFPEWNRKLFSFINFNNIIRFFQKGNEDIETNIPEDVAAAAAMDAEVNLPVDEDQDDIFDRIERSLTPEITSESEDQEQDQEQVIEIGPGNLFPEEPPLDRSRGVELEMMTTEQDPSFDLEGNEYDYHELDHYDEEDLKIEAELDNPDEPFNPRLDLSKYVIPSTDLLDAPVDTDNTISKSEVNENSNQIVNTLLNYKIDITKILATVGPTVTLYEIIPAPGVRISKIKNLEDDIALSLAALGIRIIAPIPGRGTIGIEVPNQKKKVVTLREVLRSERFRNAQMEIPIAFGKTINNEVFVADLTKMPHLLVAGATGQGKSVGINAILMSILLNTHPAHVKLILIDPKKVELSIYAKLEKHFMCMIPGQDDPIITDYKLVINTLHSVAKEMDDRYDLLKKAEVRNIKEYNIKFVERRLNPQKGHRYLPYIVFVIDEFADLIMTAGKEIETPIGRIAQLARAVGIHLVIATQRPSVNIITGIIKANFPARIAFKVASKIDSRTILDSGGAEQLIGKGDMLISAESKLQRIQCAFVDTHEVVDVVDFIAKQQGYATPYYLPEVMDDSDGGNGSVSMKLSEMDDNIKEAALLVVQNQHGSTSMIQRRLSLGYNRAGRIMDQLEALGIVGPSEGSKPRQVLFHTETELMNYFDSLEAKVY